MSRTWLATKGPKRRRSTILTFVLPRNARVEFTITQLAPTCRLAGHFAVRGHEGRNRIRFAGKVGRKHLGPGTYRISARTRGGANVLRVTIAIVDAAAPSRGRIAALRAANACPAFTSQDGAFGGQSSGGVLSSQASRSQHVNRALEPKNGIGSGSSSDPSGSAAHAIAVGVKNAAEKALKPLLVAGLGIAILLLGLAALPATAVPDPRLNDTLIRHRTEIALAGGAALVAVIAAFLLA